LELFDSHAHLDLLSDPAAVMQRARAAGVSQVATIGVDLASSAKAAALAAQLEGVCFSVGLHPHDAIQAQEPGYWQRLEQLARQGAVAVGECGLDFYRDRSPRDAQRQAFARQIEMAIALDLPLIIHDRDAHAEVAGMLTDLGAGRVGGVLHCFSGDLALAKQVLDLGFMIGITGTVTYPKNQALRDLAKTVPLSRLVIETDCPYLTPVPHRGKDNEPSYLPLTCAGLAQALGKDPAQVAAQTTANARRLYRLSEA
jgi:TatD DNase family protein